MDDKYKVRLLRLHKAVCQRNYEALNKYRQQCDAAGRESLFTRMLTGKRVSGIIPPAPEYESSPDISGLFIAVYRVYYEYFESKRRVDFVQNG